MEVEFATKPYEITFGPVVDGVDGILKNKSKTLLDEGEFTNYAVSIGIQCMGVGRGEQGERWTPLDFRT